MPTVALLFLLLLGGVWLARRTIATRVVDRALARAGVPARYTVAGVGPRGQRLEGVVLGDPADPDLVADWIETDTAIGLSGARLTGVRAGRVRLRARLVDGRVSLGSLDRLMPPPSGKPFALPRLRIASDDVGIRLATPAGPVAIGLAGEGRLDGGFRGTIAARAPRLALGGCTLTGVAATPVRVTIARAAPTLAGPVHADRIDCATARAGDVRADVALTLSAALDRWRGTAAVRTGQLAGGAARAQALTGEVGFAGDARGTAGRVAMMVGRAALPGQGQAAALRVDGRYRLGGAGPWFGGTVAADHAAVDPRILNGAGAITRSTAGSPAESLVAGIAGATRRAGRDLALDAAITIDAARRRAEIATLSLAAASGARLTLDAPLIVADWARDPLPPSAAVALGGGGLPSLTLRGTRRGGALDGVVALRRPYEAGDTRLMMTPARFRVDRDGAQVTTVATLSAPIGGGRVERLTLPVEARRRGGVVTIGPRCVPVAADRLALSNLVLDAPRLTLCPVGGALLRVADGRVGGGATLAATTLNGRLGATPLTLAAGGGRVDPGRRGFTLRDVAARLGSGELPSRLGFATLDGTMTAGAVAGGFTGGSGRIGAVPLDLSEAAGTWRFARGALSLDGALTVADTVAPARFQRMRGERVRLTLADGMVAATGDLIEPGTATRVADVAIRHRLSDGTGSADLVVAGLTFGPKFQPELLTRVTFGVIADVRGTVSGRGRIDWGAAGVTSTGRFATDGIDLAAAFGPVKGIAGTIAFDDLLGLRTAPGQSIRVASINPGIEVTDGEIRFRTLSPTQVAVDRGVWPFAGGTLTLAPTLLDFGENRARRMTFAVAGAAADRFLQQFDFDNLNATGIFDGVLPMVFDDAGGRIEAGRLQVRPGGGSLAYVGDLTQKDLGLWGNLAFGALRSLRYRDLSVVMNGPLSGEMVTEVRFAGISQGEGAESNFLIRRLQRLPFVFNIRIKAPFRGLLDSAQSFYDPRRLIQRNLPALIDAQRRRTTPDPVPPPAPAIQPSASENKP